MSKVSIEKLTQILHANFPAFHSLVSCDRLSGGASQETYRIAINSAAGEQKLAMRRQAGGVFDQSDPHRCGLKVEAQLMRAARTVDVPVPEVYHVLTREDAIGDGFIMQWLDGETLGPRIVKSPELSAIRPKLAGMFGDAAALIHSIDLQATGLADNLPTLSPEQYVHQTWNHYKALDTPQPMIDYVGTWLIDHLPADYEPSLVHNDFRNGNIMVDEQGIVAVLDWELAHIGDPVRDLGWLCTNSWRFGKSNLAAGGVGTREDLVAGYERVSGKKVDPEHLKFWEVFGSFWWGVFCLGMATMSRKGMDKSIERSAIGRRTSECQVDCANLLMPGPVDLVPQPDEAPDLEIPQAGELLRGVEELLHGPLMEETKGRTNFMARVAGNALAMVRRELELGAESKRRELDRLQKLLNCQGDLNECRRKLAAGLGDRTIPLNAPGLTDHLRNSVVNQLAIDQPRYSGINNALNHND
jgi:aminoglycoside phosphotransferase (APT) family kinase protein